MTCSEHAKARMTLTGLGRASPDMTDDEVLIQLGILSKDAQQVVSLYLEALGDTLADKLPDGFDAIHLVVVVQYKSLVVQTQQGLQRKEGT